ncbi:MAG: hypothetical protein V5B31_02385 [Candidatus Accumulibacter propinquus]|jgi:hypothetical protein|uniref:AbiU2 domain-containing protein n=1 Tax=Candidatus Accumulibacter TaxID=327159 RepID=UPI002FC2A01A
MKHTSAEFAQLLQALSNDIVDAHIHWRMASDIAKALCDHPLVAAQSNTFWYLTHKAHVAAALQCLARAYDQEQSSLHLLSWLQIIRDNQPIFDVAEFRVRLQDNPFVESLAKSAERPDARTLEEDIARCHSTDPAVNLLVRYRGSRAAHRSKRLALKPQTASTNDLADPDVEVLLDRAKTVFNRYSYMFSAATYSTSVVGRDDYKYIFSAVEAAVQRGRSLGEA